MTTETEPDYTEAIGRPATVLQARFAGWLQSEAVGYDPTTAKTKREAFEEGVRLGVSLRMKFQASAYNRAENAKTQEANASARAERASAAPVEKAPKAEKTTAPKAAPAKKAAPGKKPATPPPAAAPVANRPLARRAPRRAGAAPAATASATDAPF